MIEVIRHEKDINMEPIKSTPTNPEDAAFPWGPVDTGQTIYFSTGMTTRQFAVIEAMKGLITRTSNGALNLKDAPYIGQMAVAFADTCLAEEARTRKEANHG